jgi:beta-1,4-N-acetylglucosaminyltransferase
VFSKTVNRLGRDKDGKRMDLARARRGGRPQRAAGAPRRAMLVCSPGGHLQQMLALEPAWKGFDVVWATLPGSDVEYLLDGRQVCLGHGPTNRSFRKLLRNLGFAWRTVRASRPDVILSTGAGLALPMFLVGRLHGARLVYVESLTRTRGLSLTGRLVQPLAHEFFVQWPAARSGKARYVGSVL